MLANSKTLYAMRTLIRHHRLTIVGFTGCCTGKHNYLKICFILLNSADPDGMPLSATFHQGLHCL